MRTDALVVRGSLTDGKLIAFWQRHGTVTAARNVDVWDVVDGLRAIVTGRHPLDPDRLGDPRVPLSELA